ncbi:39S ribosomal protein L37, mitochondrial isoform X2 [Ischnura elegans]|uniref:39S ribosomal protein L37, mitochondrial isoform X2 n=1 Tax=Ischnura elegans TaxID=197161 RepID=UPI001ED88C26|nr:39S ribosomal protein L37, mitochondrial isoform X2 [Ischnura elegans]
MATVKIAMCQCKIVECHEDLPVEDESYNPMWNPRPCYLYKNHSSLLEGLDQAKRLTNTVEIEEGLPSKFQLLMDKSNPELDEKLVKRCIMSSHVFDATQQKLPKLHNPEKPTWVFPRVYGIVDKRRCRLMCLNLTNLCQMKRHSKNIEPLFLMESQNVSVPLEKDGSLIQLECRADLMLMAKNPLPPIADDDVVRGTIDIPLPDLYPMEPTVSLLKENLYDLQDIFPLQPNTSNASLHTVFFHYNETEVKNLYDLPVTEKQFMGRSLVHTFAVAAAQARHSLKNEDSDLTHPITLQSIHTDGKRFHFAVFQLNTMNLNGGSGIRNIFWHTPVSSIFEECGYKEGRPELVGYNDDVSRNTLAFFMNR